MIILHSIITSFLTPFYLCVVGFIPFTACRHCLFMNANRKTNLGIWRWSPSKTEAKLFIVIQAKTAQVELTYTFTKLVFIITWKVILLAGSNDREAVAKLQLLSCSVFAYTQFKQRSPAKARPCGQRWITAHWHTDSWAIRSPQPPAEMSRERLMPLAQSASTAATTGPPSLESCCSPQLCDTLRFPFPTHGPLKICLSWLSRRLW